MTFSQIYTTQEKFWRIAALFGVIGALLFTVFAFTTSAHAENRDGYYAAGWIGYYNGDTGSTTGWQPAIGAHEANVSGGNATYTDLDGGGMTLWVEPSDAAENNGVSLIPGSFNYPFAIPSHVDLVIMSDGTSDPNSPVYEQRNNTPEHVYFGYETNHSTIGGVTTATKYEATLVDEYRDLQVFEGGNYEQFLLYDLGPNFNGLQDNLFVAIDDWDRTGEIGSTICPYDDTTGPWCDFEVSSLHILEPVETVFDASCPFTPDADDTLVDISASFGSDEYRLVTTEGVVANTFEEIVSTISIPTGSYTIRTHSYDVGDTRDVDPAQPYEQWNVLSSDGQSFGPTTDLEDNVLEAYATNTLATDAQITSQLSSVTAEHARRGESGLSGGLNGVVPVCILFERTGDVTEALTATARVTSNLTTNYALTNFVGSYSVGADETTVHTYTFPMGSDQSTSESFTIAPDLLDGYNLSVSNSQGGGATMLLSPGDDHTFTIDYAPSLSCTIDFTVDEQESVSVTGGTSVDFSWSSSETQIDANCSPSGCGTWSGQKPGTGSTAFTAPSSDGSYDYTLFVGAEGSGSYACSDVVTIAVGSGSGNTECSDDVDNADPDSLIDENDPGCHTDGDPTNTTSYDPTDDSENDPECSDSIDNDGDDLIDIDDPGCHDNEDITQTYRPLDDDETDSLAGAFELTKPSNVQIDPVPDSTSTTTTTTVTGFGGFSDWPVTISVSSDAPDLVNASFSISPTSVSSGDGVNIQVYSPDELAPEAVYRVDVVGTDSDGDVEQTWFNVEVGAPDLEFEFEER